MNFHHQNGEKTKYFACKRKKKHMKYNTLTWNVCDCNVWCKCLIKIRDVWITSAAKHEFFRFLFAFYWLIGMNLQWRPVSISCQVVYTHSRAMWNVFETRSRSLYFNDFFSSLVSFFFLLSILTHTMCAKMYVHVRANHKKKKKHLKFKCTFAVCFN